LWVRSIAAVDRRTTLTAIPGGIKRYSVIIIGGTTVVAAHSRYPVSAYPLDGDRTNDIIGSTPILHQTAHCRDGDVVIDVFENATPTSVAVRTGVPGARP
jgi:hypothetical protein